MLRSDPGRHKGKIVEGRLLTCRGSLPTRAANCQTDDRSSEQISLTDCTVLASVFVFNPGAGTGGFLFGMPVGFARLNKLSKRTQPTTGSSAMKKAACRPDVLGGRSGRRSLSFRKEFGKCLIPHSITITWSGQAKSALTPMMEYEISFWWSLRLCLAWTYV